MIYRRFARVLEFDRKPLSGTKAQQHAIRDAIRRHAPYGSPLNQTLYQLDVAVNLTGRRFIPVSFVDFAEKHWLGFTTPTIIQLSQALDPDWIEPTFFHELGHLIGWHLPAWAGRSCDDAARFQQWVSEGQDINSEVWKRLETP